MKRLLTADVITFVLVLIFTSGADSGYYCTGKKQPWINANKDCLDNGGKPLSYKTDLNNILNALLVNQSTLRSTWTNDYLKHGGNDSTELCAFRYRSGTSLRGQMFYGDCSKNRSYICREAHGWRIHEGYYKRAITECGEIGSNYALNYLSNNFDFTPRYYWVKATLKVNRVTFNVQYGDEELGLIDKPLKCGAYSKDLGFYFRTCTDGVSSFCHFTSRPPEELYKPCLKEREALSKRPLLNTSVTSHVSIVTADVKSSNESTTTIISISTSQISNSSTENYQQGNMNVVVTKPTSSQSDTKEPKENSHVKLKEDGNNSNLGINVGLPVGLCLMLIFGITLSIYIARRLRCWKKTEVGNNNSKPKRPEKGSSNGLVHTYYNVDYDGSDDKHIRIIKQEETYTELQYTDKKSQQYTELNFAK